MSSEAVLSICIPTFNRASYLDQSLQSLVKQIGNNDEVEIIISDNFSDDNTREICSFYENNYKNVKYYRNDTNIGGNQNFIKALKLGQGKYLKLLNDYLEFKDGYVLKMLEIVKNHYKSKEVLFFANGLSHLKRKEFHCSKNLSEFLLIATDRSTWIGSFGIWREDFWYLIENYTFKTSSFLHTELLFESVNLRKNALTYSRQMFKIHDLVNKKAGYNFFDIFINHYFNKVIGGLKKEKKITYWTYLQEKNRFFSNFIFMWYKKIKIKKDHSADYDTKNSESIIFRNYKYNVILYLYLLYLPFYMIGFYIKKLIRQLQPANLN